MCTDSGGSGQSAAAERLYGIQGDISQGMFDNWRSTYMPLEAKTIKQVEALNDPNYISNRVGQAQQDVSGAFSRERGIQQRRLQGLGLNPADGRYDAAERQMGLAEAGARAGAANSTRDGLKRESLQAQMGLMQTGRGIANAGMTGAGQAASGLAGLANASNAKDAANTSGTAAALGAAASYAMWAWG